MRKKSRCTLYYCLFTLLAAASLLGAARLSAGFAEWYASRIFPLFPHTLGRLFSPLPFSVLELLITLGTAALLLFIAYSLIMLARGRAGRARHARGRKGWWPSLAACCCTALLMFTLTCGINYSRAPLAQALGLEPRPSSAQELRQLFSLLCAEASVLVEDIQTDEQGYFTLPQAPRQEGRAAMRRLGNNYALLNAYYPQPKAVFFSKGLSYLHIAGIYSPFTVEANYNRDIPPGDIPFSICHELAHLAGFAREDEANFIAYLACRGSGNNGLHYSGLLNALIYVLNALYSEIAPAEYSDLLRELPEQARRDLQHNAAYWQSFAGPAAQISQSVNDIYLKANNQPQGVKSYGRMVDLLLAYYVEDRR